jgi:S-adenosylmethionine-dependent methyltransferase
LDVGAGTGASAVRLAKLGHHVTLLDSARLMLDLAERAAREVGVTELITCKHGDAAQLGNLFHAESFDLILCHNILEYFDDPCAVLCGVARALRESSSMISILVRNQAGEVLKAAIKDGDLAATERNLTAEWVHESLYGGRVRLFTQRAFKPCCSNRHSRELPSAVYGFCRTTCRRVFPEVMSTSGFLS